MLAVTMVSATALVSSCDDDDEVIKTPLATTSITEGADKSVSKLTFQWQNVEGAVQYAYELRDSHDQLILGNVTKTTSLVATGLTPNTTYTFSVWAFAAINSEKTTCPIATITATTNAKVPLKMSAPAHEVTNNIVTISWTEVAHADYYQAYLINSKNDTLMANSNIEESSVAFNSLSDDTYVFKIKACSFDENFSDSEIVSYEFSFENVIIESWSGKGTMYTPAGDSFETSIILQADGSYLIRAFNGVEGYDLAFTINADFSIEITNSDQINQGYYYVDAGNGCTAHIYPSGGYSSFETTDEGGKVWFYAYLYDAYGYLVADGYYDFTWTRCLSIDDICGEYTETTSCLDWTYDWATWTSVENQESDITIEKIDDTHVNIYNFYGWADNMTAEVNLDEGTLTITPLTSWGGYYGFSATSGETDPVVGYINDDGSISFDDWTAWYGSQIIYHAKTVMTRKQ